MSLSEKDITLKRVQTLLDLARTTFDMDPSLSQRYVYLARRIAMASRTHLPKEFRFRICRHCKHYVIPGFAFRVRIKKRRYPHIVVTCPNCGKHMRMPIAEKREN